MIFSLYDNTLLKGYSGVPLPRHLDVRFVQGATAGTGAQCYDRGEDDAMERARHRLWLALGLACFLTGQDHFPLQLGL